MANFEAFRWNFLSSTNPEFGRSAEAIAASMHAWHIVVFCWVTTLPTTSLSQGVPTSIAASLFHIHAYIRIALT